MHLAALQQQVEGLQQLVLQQLLLQYQLQQAVAGLAGLLSQVAARPQPAQQQQLASLQRQVDMLQQLVLQPQQQAFAGPAGPPPLPAAAAVPGQAVHEAAARRRHKGGGLRGRAAHQRLGVLRKRDAPEVVLLLMRNEDRLKSAWRDVSGGGQGLPGPAGGCAAACAVPPACFPAQGCIETCKTLRLRALLQLLQIRGPHCIWRSRRTVAMELLASVGFKWAEAKDLLDAAAPPGG